MTKDVPDKKRLKLLGSLATGDVLDIGCHDVQNAYLKNVVGLDIRRPRELQQNYRRFVQGDCHVVDKLFPARCFDTIVAGEIIEHLENPTKFLRACRRVIKHDGRLLITTPNPYHWTTVVGNLLFNKSGLAFDHINLFPFRTMVALLHHSGWELVDVRNASRGMRLWHTTRKLFVPCPKAVAWQLLYVARTNSTDQPNS
jgi:2-polyprenyl-3-methyl-5-hydroxy-6-metoxy-1,4-benzoquinol methylase